MFTGIVTDLGRVREITGTGDTHLVFETGYDTESLDLGASVACSGVCLTVVDKGPGCFAVDVSAETLARTTLGSWRPETPVNFERALKVGDEMGGHIVAGHVDAVAAVIDREPDGSSFRFTLEAPEALAGLIAPRGSVTLDGVSLTVNQVEGPRFGVTIIPHTAEVTSFGGLGPGDQVNLEIDLLARYVQRLMQERS